MNEWEWNLLEDKATLDQIEIEGVIVRPGSRVRLNPKDGGDILDLALRGQVAVVECIEEDYEDAKHVCVVLENDPGRDLGMLRQPGHRFFFTPSEIEPLADEAAPASLSRITPRWPGSRLSSSLESAISSWATTASALKSHDVY